MTLFMHWNVGKYSDLIIASPDHNNFSVDLTKNLVNKDLVFFYALMSLKILIKKIWIQTRAVSCIVQGLSSLEIKIKSKCKYRAVSCIVKRMSKKYVFFIRYSFLCPVYLTQRRNSWKMDHLLILMALRKRRIMYYSK